MSDPQGERLIPAPAIYPDNIEFWAATARGRLLLRHCEDCDRPHWYPRSQCPLCLSDRLRWRESAGLGEVYSFSVCRRIGPQPYVIAYVRLDEGVTLLTNLVDADPESIRIGARVRLLMKASEGGTPVPMFTPV